MMVIKHQGESVFYGVGTPITTCVRSVEIKHPNSHPELEMSSSGIIMSTIDYAIV